MATIRPFRALRFTETAGSIEQLICPPYDTITESERQSYLAHNPYNIIRLELPRDGDDPYAMAGQTLSTWLQDGIVRQDDIPALYIYSIDFTIKNETKSVFGLIAQVKIEPFEKGVILPHEETLSKAKEDRFQLMRATGCNFSSVYALYTDDGGESETTDILSLIMQEQPLQTAVDTVGSVHKLWSITDETLIASITARFTDTKLFIADGHHRYETALRYRDTLRDSGAPTDEADYMMMMLVETNQPGLVVFPTHRMIRGITGFSAERVLTACKPYFEVISDLPLAMLTSFLDDAYANEEKAVAFYAGGDAFTLLKLKSPQVMSRRFPQNSAAYCQLDVNILHSLILEPVLGIDKANMAQQRNLTYTRNAAEAIDNVRCGAYQCSFLLNPTRVSEICDVAAAGEKMPQKSTYFYPKLITGLTMNKLK